MNDKTHEILALACTNLSNLVHLLNKDAEHYAEKGGIIGEAISYSRACMASNILRLLQQLLDEEG